METRRTTQELIQSEIVRKQLHSWLIDMKEARRRLAKLYLLIT